MEMKPVNMLPPASNVGSIPFGHSVVEFDNQTVSIRIDATTIPPCPAGSSLFYRPKDNTWNVLANTQQVYKVDYEGVPK